MQEYTISKCTVMLLSEIMQYDGATGWVSQSIDYRSVLTRTEAIKFDVNLCNNYNISTPDFIGCSPLSSGASYNIGPTSSEPSTMSTSTSMSSLSTVTNVEAAYTTTIGGPVASFDGASLLTGSCTAPRIASYSMPSNGSLQFPWIGCSNQDPDCCPFDPASAGPLSVCPQDYSTISGACCPSGWSVYTSTIAGQTPCYTTPSMLLVAPISSIPSGSPTPSIVNAQIFTLQYVLAPPSGSSLSNGAKAGIIVGSIIGAVLLAAAAVLFVRYRRREAQAIRDATMPRLAYDPHDYASQKGQSPMTPHSIFSRARTVSSPQTIAGTSIPELPSPPPISATSPNVPNWPVPQAMSSVVVPVTHPMPQPVMELPGSTFINEHHPAFGGTSPERVASPAMSIPEISITSEEIYRPPFASVERLPSPGSGR